MTEHDLQEMITAAQAAGLVAAAELVAICIGLVLLVIALILGHGRVRAGLLRASATLAPLGLLLAAGWDGYIACVRFNPATGFCGLHSVRVWLGLVGVAVGTGLAYGVYLRWLWSLPLEAPARSPLSEEA